MTYEQKLKWREMERLLPMLVESLEKVKKCRRFSNHIYEVGRDSTRDEKVKLIEMTKEIQAEENYLEQMTEVVKGTKIRRNQITPKEAEGLAYLMWLEELSISDFFDDYEYVPIVILSKVQKTYDNEATFFDATFEDVFGLY